MKLTVRRKYIEYNSAYCYSSWRRLHCKIRRETQSLANSCQLWQHANKPQPSSSEHSLVLKLNRDNQSPRYIVTFLPYPRHRQIASWVARGSLSSIAISRFRMRNGISMEFMHVIMEQIAANVVIRIEYLGEQQLYPESWDIL